MSAPPDVSPRTWAFLRTGGRYKSNLHMNSESQNYLLCWWSHLSKAGSPGGGPSRDPGWQEQVWTKAGRWGADERAGRWDAQKADYMGCRLRENGRRWCVREFEMSVQRGEEKCAKKRRRHTESMGAKFPFHHHHHTQVGTKQGHSKQPRVEISSGCRIKET